MNILGTIQTFVLDEKIKSILKLKDDYSFFAIPNDLLNKYGIEKFQIVDYENEIMLVGPKVNRSGPTSNPTSNEVDIIG